MDDETNQPKPLPGAREQTPGLEGPANAPGGDQEGSSAAQDITSGQERPEGHTGQHRHVRIVPEPGAQTWNGPEPAEPEPSAPSEQAARVPRPNKFRPDLRQEEHVRGSHPGDRYIKVGRTVGPFRRKGAGLLEVSTEADEARSPFGRLFNQVKHVLIGQPISTEHSIHERLTKVKALAVLSSDALSSVAYATEEILRVLIVLGLSAAAGLSIPVALGVIVLLAIVVASYRQTIAAYPRGGGSYIVAKDNLGTLPGLTAAASILIDYTMTVAVSVSAGIDAVNSLFPSLLPYKVDICLAIIVLVTLANLRGVREAGNIFAVPTYLFIIGILAMVGIGLVRIFFGGGIAYVPPPGTLPVGQESLTGFAFIFLLLRAFSQGCTALTGVEAISDGVPAFKPPEAKNARTTLVWMGVLAITMFGGITFLAANLHVIPSDAETVLSQVARNVFGGPGPAWFFINIVTALILVLAANTAFSDFPRLSYFLARDKFMPHQFSFRGDRLAFSWGIVTLALLACIIIVGFSGNVTALIPLYTVGVFNSFTLSQWGMVMRWWRTRGPGWRRSMVINGLGALATFIVLIISATTKFLLGAWIVVVLIPVLIAMFLAINRHYRRFATDAEAVTPINPEEFKHTIIVPIAALNYVARSALAYARSLSPNVTAVHIAEGEDTAGVEQFNEEWHRVMGDTDIPIVIIESPYRSLIGPLLSYIDALDQQSPDDTITVVLPELIPARPWEYLLHNQSALRLKAALLFRPNTVVANVPYVLGRNRTAQEIARRRGFLRGFPWGPVLVSTVALLILYLFVHR
jgi:amino acid transporter